MYKACSVCGKIHPYNAPCKKPVIYGRDETRKLRATNRWKEKSKQVRNDVLFCEVCKAQGRFVYDNLEVHHIEKLRNNREKLLDDNNLICLCTYHHKLADAGEISADYLREIVRKRLSEEAR